MHSKPFTYCIWALTPTSPLPLKEAKLDPTHNDGTFLMKNETLKLEEFSSESDHRIEKDIFFPKKEQGGKNLGIMNPKGPNDSLISHFGIHSYIDIYQKQKQKKGVQSFLRRDIYFMLFSLSCIAHPMQSRSGYRIQSLIWNFLEGQDKPKEIYNLK